MVIAPQGSIFRESAVKRYRQRQEQGILLRIASPRIMLFFWVVLLLLLGAGGFAWSIHVPIKVQGQGVIIEQGMVEKTGGGVVALLFFAPGQVANLHPGQPAVVSIGSSGLSVPGSIEHIETTLMSPNEARSRFNLQGGLAQVITGPSVIVSVSIGSAASRKIYVGSMCVAQIEIGSQNVLSLLPGLGQLFG